MKISALRLALAVIIPHAALMATEAPKDPLETNSTAQTPSSNAATDAGKPAKMPLKFGMFVDTYFSASVLRPASNDRQYSTQAARDREFNINLAHLDANYDSERVRGRLALQFGTSVNANYQNEPTTPAYSNQFSTRNMQEAFAGLKLAKGLWLDAGIFFGNIGMESWISHNNWNYTRALNLDNVPYYSSGARLSWQATNKLAFQLHVLNGWQIITPVNRDKSVGTQIAYDLSNQFKVIHNTFGGNVAPDGSPAQYRYYSNLILQYSPFRQWQFALTSDVGWQSNPNGNTYRQWYAGALYARYLFAHSFAAAVRFEYYVDPTQVMVASNTKDGFQTVGFTTNFDYMPEDSIRLRLEYRNFFNKDAVYQNASGAAAQEHLVTVGMSLKI